MSKEKLPVDLEKLISLAKIVRSACEIYVKKQYYYSLDLCNLCSNASSVLFRLAKKHGIEKVRLGGNDFHVFVLLENTIVDITATQFGVREKVAIRNLTRARSDWWQLKEMLNKVEISDKSAYQSITKIAKDLLEKGD